MKSMDTVDVIGNDEFTTCRCVDDVTNVQMVAIMKLFGGVYGHINNVPYAICFDIFTENISWFSNYF